MNTQLHTLDNGLRVILIDTKAFPSITTLVLVGAGSRYETVSNNGIAHFFEHMVFKGSKKYPNSFLVASAVESVGGIINAFTSKDHTGYWIKATTESFEKVADVLSDMLLSSLFLGEEIEREKGVITEEINLYEDTPYRKIGDIFEELLYKGNPLGYDIAGTKETVSTFTKKTFVDYMKQLYYPTNSVIVVAGGLSGGNGKGMEYYLETIRNKFSSWKGDKMHDFKKMHEKQTKPQLFLKEKKTEQAHFALGFRAFSFFDKRKYALSVLSTLLGGGMSSPLFIQVRERRGLCYYISTGKELYHDVGNMVTQAGVVNKFDKIQESIRVILEEHEKIVKGKIKNKELAKTKELLKGRMLLSFEDSFNIALFFGLQLLRENTYESPEVVMNKLEKVTKEQVIDAAVSVITKKALNFALIGPFGDPARFKEVLTNSLAD